MEYYDEIKRKIREIIATNKIEDKTVEIKAKVLTPGEAIGNPEHDDYPLLKGRERLMQAQYKGATGVAFTDMFGNHSSLLSEIIDMDLTNNFRRAIFIATLNAVLRFTGHLDKTVHCKDDGLVRCGRELKEYISLNYGKPRILQVGHQPRFTEVLSGNFDFRVVDLDKKNIGKSVNNARICSENETNEFIKWADLLFVTGSTFVNGTFEQFIKTGKELIFYGVTGQAPAYLLGFKRFCPESN